MSTIRSAPRPAGTCHARPTLEVLEAREVPAVSSAEAIGMFDPAAGTWYLRGSTTSGLPNQGKFFYGSPGDKALVGDWDGDGVMGIGVVRGGVWYLRNSVSQGAPDVASPFGYGAPGWIPVVGDWDGNGTDDIGVFDPVNAVWYLRTRISAGAPDAGKFQYGPLGSRPVVGDWNGDGKDGIAAFDSATAIWYVRDAASGGGPDAVFQYGVGGWTPVAGDWLGTGRSLPGVVDPGSTWYLRSSLTTGVADVATFQYGGTGWSPVVGKWAALQPLLAEGPAGAQPFSITQSNLDTEVQGVVRRFQVAGLSAGRLLELGQFQYVLADLEGDQIAVTDYATRTISVDFIAAGRGWFVDPTPGTDEEFNSDGTGKAGSGALGGIDLVTVLVNQMANLSLGNDGSLPRLGIGFRTLGGGGRLFGVP